MSDVTLWKCWRDWEDLPYSALRLNTAIYTLCTTDNMLTTKTAKHNPAHITLLQVSHLPLWLLVIAPERRSTRLGMSCTTLAVFRTLGTTLLGSHRVIMKGLVDYNFIPCKENGNAVHYKPKLCTALSEMRKSSPRNQNYFSILHTGVKGRNEITEKRAMRPLCDRKESWGFSTKSNCTEVNSLKEHGSPDNITGKF